MKICSLYRIFYAALFAVVATLSQLAWAQDAHRDKLEAFFSAVELPKTRELFSLLIAEIRQRVPHKVIGERIGAKKMTDFLTSSRELLLDLHDISDEYRKVTGDPANKI